MNEQLENDLKVVIIGGGIGGFATAVALQNKGIKAHIYEQASELGEIGAGIVIHPPTQHLFKEWGLDKAFNERVSIVEAVELFTGQGEFLTTITEEIFSSLKKDPAGLRPGFIHRAHLLDLLIEPIDAEYIHLGHKLESLIETDDHVEVTFENGEVVRADVVIAANGIHSKVRTLLSNDEPIYSGVRTVRAILSREATKEVSKEEAAIFYREGSTLILLSRVANGVHFDILHPSDDTSWAMNVTKEELIATISPFNEKLAKLVDEIEYPALSRALYYRQPIDKWSTKRITLLGDAAHPMLPILAQGANTAIGDAHAIARALSEHETVEEALQQYENERCPIASEIQMESQQWDKLFDLVKI